MNEVNRILIASEGWYRFKAQKKTAKNLHWLEFHGDVFPGAKEGDAQVDGQEEEVGGEGDQ